MAECRYVFGETPREIHVHARPSISDEPFYVATAYVVEDNGHTLREVRDANGQAVELPASSEDAALGRAVALLEVRHGQRGEPMEA